MNNASQATEAVISAVISTPSLTLEYCYELCARYGFEGDSADDILDAANVSGTVIESCGRLVGIAVFAS